MLDDFLADPWEARAQALALPYDRAAKRGNYPGVTSSAPLPIPGLDETVSRLIGAPVKGAAGTLHGHCRLTLKGETGRTGPHIDPCFYSGILYLSPPERCRGGTSFFRHRPTGLERVPSRADEIARAGFSDVNALVEQVVNADTRHPAKWEKTFTAPMRFSRLILFSPWLFHDAGPGFGDTPDSARLVQLMFFAPG